jgi:hypothetical protein
MVPRDNVPGSEPYTCPRGGKVADLVTIGWVEPVYTQTGRLTGYRLEVRHQGLHEYRLLRAPDQYVLKNKEETQLAAWSEKWQRASTKNAHREIVSRTKESADRLTERAQIDLEKAKTLLISCTRTRSAIDWEKLQDHRPFSFDHAGRFPKVQFDANGKPVSVSYASIKSEPLLSHYVARPTFLDGLIPGRRRKRAKEAQDRFDYSHAAWRDQCHEATKSNRELDKQLKDAQQAFDLAQGEYQAKQEAANREVAELKGRYEVKESAAVVSVAELILNGSVYPEWMTKDFLASYNVNNNTLVLDYTLPVPERLPSIAKVVYIASGSEMRTTFLNDAEKVRLFDLFSIKSRYGPFANYLTAIRQTRSIQSSSTAGSPGLTERPEYLKQDASCRCRRPKRSSPELIFPSRPKGLFQGVEGDIGFKTERYNSGCADRSNKHGGSSLRC